MLAETDGLEIGSMSISRLAAASPHVVPDSANARSVVLWRSHFGGIQCVTLEIRDNVTGAVASFASNKEAAILEGFELESLSNEAIAVKYLLFATGLFV